MCVPRRSRLAGGSTDIGTDYGRAKELPGVKELFTELAAPQKKQDRSKTDFARYKIDDTYYGRGPLQDEEELLAWEAEREVELQRDTTRDRSVAAIVVPEFSDFTAEDVEAMLLERHKADLLARYAAG